MVPEKIFYAADPFTDNCFRLTGKVWVAGRETKSRVVLALFIRHVSD